MPRSDQRWLERQVPARSARTRPTCRSAPLRPDMAIGRLVKGMVEKWQSFKYRDVSVKHATTSPSRRDRSRQVAVLRAFQNQPHPNKSFSHYARSQPIHIYSLARIASERLSGHWCEFLLFKGNEAPVPRLRNYDTTLSLLISL